MKILKFLKADEDGEEDEECKSPEINADASTGNFKYDELYEKIIIVLFFYKSLNHKIF